jgi:hypothetical protein
MSDLILKTIKEGQHGAAAYGCTYLSVLLLLTVVSVAVLYI